MSAILRNLFYHIDHIEKVDNGMTARITFDTEHPIFKGHFPDMPIVPGVCQTQMLGEILSEALGKDLQLASASSIKFLSLVDPTKTPTLDLNISYTLTEDGSYNVSAQYTWEQTVFFKFKGGYKAI